MFRSFRIAWFVAALLAAIGFAIPAQANDAWFLVQAIGEVSVAAPGAAPAPAKTSAKLPNGATIKTGANGRAVLLRGRESIVMSPSSAVTLPAGSNSDFSKVQQQSGLLLFKIGKKPQAHFEVNTPYLAAVVKGTTFTVKVSGAGASVHVLEGAVEVTTLDRMQSYLTRAGQISSVFAKAASDIFTTGASAIGGGDVSGGLWDGEGDAFEFDGRSPWDAPTNTRVIGNTGLKSLNRAPPMDKELTEQAPERAVKTAHSVKETLGASVGRKQAQKPTDKVEKPQAAADKKSAPREPKTKQLPEKRLAEGRIAAAPKPQNVWAVTQAKGDVRIDGYAFTNFGDSLARTLSTGTKVETGPLSRLGVALGPKEFIIEENSVVVLGNAEALAVPMVVSGQALHYSEDTSRYEAVANLTPSEVEALRASGVLDDAPSKGAAASSARLAGGGNSGPSASTESGVPLPRVASMPSGAKTKTEEVRTKVIGGLTLGLYGLTALLVLAFGTQWAWRRYKSKAKKQPVESAAQVRLRNITGR